MTQPQRSKPPAPPAKLISLSYSLLMGLERSSVVRAVTAGT